MRRGTSLLVVGVAVAVLVGCTATPETVDPTTTSIEAVVGTASIVPSTTNAVDTTVPTSTPVPSDNPGSDWWQLLATVDADPGARILVVSGDAALSEVWEALGTDPPVSNVDWSDQVVFVFKVFRGANPVDAPDWVCDELWLVDMVVDEDLVYPQHGTFDVQCVMGIPRTFVIAVDRDRLPEPPFEVRRFEREDRNGVRVTAAMLAAS